jgi:hypothetical protein
LQGVAALGDDDAFSPGFWVRQHRRVESLREGRQAQYCYNLLAIQQFYADSADVLPPGDHQVCMEFTYAGGGLGKGGTVSLSVDG